MDQEKFIGTYIELLNTTLSEAIQKNIVAQSQKKVLETENLELVQRFDSVKTKFESELSTKEKEIQSLKNELNSTRQQLGNLSTSIHEANIATQHFQTFKNELSASRSEIETLKNLIAEKDIELAKLQPVPVPVVINKLAKKNTSQAESKVVKVKSIRDAGSF
jgi:chromosome segregation ATPase